MTRPCARGWQDRAPTEGGARAAAVEEALGLYDKSLALFPADAASYVQIGTLRAQLPGSARVLGADSDRVSRAWRDALELHPT